MPDFLVNLMNKLGIDADQCIINHYNPGEGISYHIDNTQHFDDAIYVLSLMSPIVMCFKHGSQEKTKVLEPRSLMVMSGEARYHWSHAIPARKSDIINGKLVKRGIRISITFRTVKN